MNKETHECEANVSRSAAVPIGLSSSKVHLHGDDHHHATDRARWVPNAYLRALEVPVEERTKLFNKTAENAYTHKSLSATRLASSQMIHERCDLLADEQRIDGNAPRVRDPVLASIESRLRIWLTAGSMPDRQHRETGLELQDLKPVEMLIVSPPINRAHMPTAKLECKTIGRMVSTMFNALTAARSLTVQTFRRLLVKMRFDAYGFSSGWYRMVKSDNDVDYRHSSFE